MIIHGIVMKEYVNWSIYDLREQTYMQDYARLQHVWKEQKFLS